MMMKRTVSTLFELPGEDDPSASIPGSKRNATSQSGEESTSYSSSRGIGEVLMDHPSSRRRKDHNYSVTRSDFRSRVVLIDKAPPAPASALLRSFAGGRMITNHFLKSCFRCKKDIVTHDQDIFMYKCKTFCSSDCRHREMHLDERESKLQRVATATA